MMMYIDLMTCIIWRCMIYIRCDCWEILYMHVDVICWRRSVYFLNICSIRVFYRFNINRALQQPPYRKEKKQRVMKICLLFWFFFIGSGLKGIWIGEEVLNLDMRFFVVVVVVVVRLWYGGVDGCGGDDEDDSGGGYGLWSSVMVLLRVAVVESNGGGWK